MEIVIAAENLFKNYGDVKAVDGISFSVKKSEMFGLVGPDGAGKTTTIRMLCSLINPDSGTITMLGKNISSDTRLVQDNAGYLSQKFSLYGDLTVDENIEFFADIHNVTGYQQRRDELLAFTRLTQFRKRQAEKLSGGMKQKLALACSLIHKPKVIFLDEPTTGVDPVSRRDFWKILSALQKEGITILMTTPYLDEAERCNRVALMNRGKLIVTDTPEKIKAATGKQVIEIIAEDTRLAYKFLKDNSNFDVQLFGDRLNVMINENSGEQSVIYDLLNENKIEVKKKRIVTPSLENIFIHLVKESG